MTAITKFEVFSKNLADKVHNLDTDTLKLYLTNAAPVVATHAVKADLAEITAQNGYVAGGIDVQNATSRSGGTTSVTAIDVTFTAAGGTVGPFRYAVLYNDTQTSPAKPLIGYWDYGSSQSLLDGESLVGDFGANILTVGP